MFRVNIENLQSVGKLSRNDSTCKENVSYIQSLFGVFCERVLLESYLRETSWSESKSEYYLLITGDNQT